MFALCAIALLCLVSVSHSAPVACGELLKTLDQLDPQHYEGMWYLVADSISSPEPLSLSESVVLFYENSTFTKVNHDGDRCSYLSANISMEGANYHFSVGQNLNFSGTVYHTSCSDCLVLTFNMQGPHFKMDELCLLSKRREVTEEELNEFAKQVSCLRMPEHVVMDPTKPTCPFPDAAPTVKKPVN